MEVFPKTYSKRYPKCNTTAAQHHYEFLGPNLLNALHNYIKSKKPYSKYNKKNGVYISFQNQQANLANDFQKNIIFPS